MAIRTVHKIAGSELFRMDQFTVSQSLPNPQFENIDPFLLLHHASSSVPPGRSQQETGVGPHPHRGFSPVTIIYDGVIHHRDSRGHSSIVGPGGVQWMHAGMGIIHSERLGSEFLKTGGIIQLVQLWVNSPAAYKMAQPSYQGLTAEEIPVLSSAGMSIALITGHFRGLTGKITTLTPQLILNITALPQAEETFDLPVNYNCAVYLVEGQIMIGHETVWAKNLAWLANDGDQITITATTAARFLILAGEPIGEPIAKYGPFVMNTQTEVMQALRDAQIGKMGVLIEE